MQPDNIDDLFRQQLGGHATPPPADLWARLQQPAKEEPLDLQFRATLGSHATPPRREVWERLEDEHLRPRPRRQRPVVLWWQFAAAALLLLTLLGGGLWRGGFLGHPVGDIVTIEEAPTQPGQASSSALPADNQPAISSQTEVAVAPKKKQKLSATQATAPATSPSSTPIARTTRPRRPATATPGNTDAHVQGQRPDAAAAQLARAGGRKTPARQYLPHLPETTTPTLITPEAPSVLAATTPQIIEVEVRRGRPVPVPTAAPTVVAMADAEPTPARRRRLRLGGLLRQADHLVHGEAVSLAEATGLPENTTVQVRLGGRVLSRSIQL